MMVQLRDYRCNLLFASTANDEEVQFMQGVLPTYNRSVVTCDVIRGCLRSQIKLPFTRGLLTKEAADDSVNSKDNKQRISAFIISIC